MMTDSFDAVLLVRDVAFEYTQSEPFSLQAEQLGRTPSHYREYEISQQYPQASGRGHKQLHDR